MKKFLTLALAAMMIFSFTACGSTEEEVEEVVVDTYREYDSATYTDVSSETYDLVLGDFYEAYQAADEATTLSERYALQAIAEAKFLESAVALPLTTSGGYYAITRVVPHTVSFALWGVDDAKYDQLLITNELIAAEDITELRTQWSALSGTGTYVSYAKEYLEDKGYTFTDTYVVTYSTEPQTWDLLNTSRSADTEFIVNSVDGLLRYDAEGQQQPSLATSYEISEDGLTYTFYIREGVQWVDSQGREIGQEVTADDWVAGFQHMLDCGDEGGLNSLVDGIIAGAHEYIVGETTSMENVGVVAIDTYTLQYTLEEECPYFLTMLAYNWAYPMNRAYYESLGGTFGEDYAEGGAGSYGTSADTIAYCGAFLCSSIVSGNSITFTANPSYWNAENQTITTLIWSYNDGTDVTKSYNDAISGDITGATLNSSTIEVAKSATDADGNNIFDTYAYTTDTTATSFMAWVNVNRYAYSNVNDGAAASEKDANEANRTYEALLNVHFRRALACSLDRVSYNAQTTGEDLASTSLRNSYTPWNFVSLTEDVTVEINGTETTFEKGTWYGEIMQAQIDADGVEITVYDPDEANGGDGYDGWYNVEYAVSELEIAIEELAAEGYTIDEENPIYIDLPYYSGSESYTNRAYSYKQSIEDTLGGKVIVNLVACETSSEWYYAGYYVDYGYECNYDVYDVSGWGPDYGDPQTYLDTLLPDGAGYMVTLIGLY